MSIGENIRIIRERNNLSQTTLAKKIGVTQAMICQIERGAKIPSMLLGKQIAQALNCTLDDLFEAEAV